MQIDCIHLKKKVKDFFLESIKTGVRVFSTFILNRLAYHCSYSMEKEVVLNPFLESK